VRLFPRTRFLGPRASLRRRRERPM